MTVKAHCDGCESPQTIVPTGKKQKPGFSAEWWEVVEHVDEKTGRRCPGSGRQV